MKKVFFMGAICLASSGIAQQKESEKDSIKAIELEEVMVQAVRAKQTLPVTFSNLSKKEIQQRNFGQQIPMLIGQLPNVVSISEDGTGIGATSFSVRGSDTYRTNVTINGIPYNDSESQGTFWYNLSDFASSAESIQLQRGVGTSTNGAGAFGASLNVLTDAVSVNPYASISNFYGSYNTHKHSIKFSTGKINDQFEMVGRFSKINSDGYRDRASSDLKSYFLQGTYQENNTLIKTLVFGGKEKTYLTWIGIDKTTLETNRRYNPAGIFTNSEGKTQFYENETDNYQQDHAQLHWVEKWTQKWTTNLAFHYTKGRGYWENFENNRYSRYNLPPVIDISTGQEKKGNIIVQKALDNDFYGGNFSVNYQNEQIDIIFGVSANKYEGRHFREVLWAEKTEVPYNFLYRDEWSYKKEISSFAKATLKIDSKWNLFADLQYRHTKYQANSYEVDELFNFLNPKVGTTFIANKNNSIYLSYAKGLKEPNRTDYKDNYPLKPKAEHVNDFELGWNYQTNFLKLHTNLYYMLYKNQLVLTGKLNETGYPIRDNSGDSYRIGVEIDATVLFSEKLVWRPNISVSQNKNIDFYVEKSGNLINWGNTNISFSPNVVASSTLIFNPIANFSANLISKYVGEQYMTNEDEPDAKLSSYFVSNLLLSYEIKPKKLCKSIVFSVLANNILNKKYVSSGTYWGEALYFPQAQANYLAGVVIDF